MSCYTNASADDDISEAEWANLEALLERKLSEPDSQCETDQYM